MTLREQLVEVGRRLQAARHVTATEGNLSVRLDENRVLITPSGREKGSLSSEDMVVIDLEGRTESGAEPSSERHVHLETYKTRTDVQAVIHAHPRYSTGWAMARRALPWQTHPEVVVVLGQVALVPYLTPSTRELGQAVAEALGSCNACLMANHGAVAVGATLQEAFQRMEILESFAHSAMVATALGGPVALDADELAQLP
ncbi:MAG: class II aldolase/adducin family protein [Trueperaceae bacterium]|nr:MAG: class II aldolase/adducin family protein [Trueperaceae bacterium]